MLFTFEEISGGDFIDLFEDFAIGGNNHNDIFADIFKPEEISIPDSPFIEGGEEEDQKANQKADQKVETNIIEEESPFIVGSESDKEQSQITIKEKLDLLTSHF